jgi:hypothetical protein
MNVQLFGPQLEEVYGEVYRVLKPGSCFVSYEWVATDKFDPDNKDHVRIMDEINFGNGLPVSEGVPSGQCMLPPADPTKSTPSEAGLARGSVLQHPRVDACVVLTCWIPSLKLSLVECTWLLLAAGDADIYTVRGSRQVRWLRAGGKPRPRGRQRALRPLVCDLQYLKPC